MKTESFIKRRLLKSEDLDFEGLRQEGVRLVQELSGDEWTDYNLHDPGVTILEQVCYGLTDLVYRTGFPVADYLTSADGDIHYERLALHRPDEALSCGPVTENDYRRLILDAVPNVENVWIGKQAGGLGVVEGLYRIYLQLSDRVRHQDHPGVQKTYADAVRRLYASHRNLCEDLAEVRLAKRLPHGLRGEIAIDGNRTPASVLAEIYFECARYLSPRVVSRSYPEAYKNGTSLDELFTGVVTRGGYIADDDLHPWRGHFSIQELSARILGINGVRNVRSLEFVDPDGAATDCISLDGDAMVSIACLSFPADGGEIGVKLFRGDKICQAPLSDVETEFNRLNYGAKAAGGRKPRFDWIDTVLPKGEFRPINRYSSVQNHFPEVYGINAMGIGESASPERKAAAAQLKAYLLFFEQIMANFLQNAQEIPSLFSPDEQPAKSYFHQVLMDDRVPGAESIYRYGRDEMETKLAEVVEGFDNFAERKNRILDYLLGLYGEDFAQNSLRHHFAADVHHNVAAMRNKIAFLKGIVDTGRKRASAFDYRKEPGGDNSSGLERKLGILLGLDAAEADFHLVEHVLLRPAEATSDDARRTSGDFYGFRLSVVFPADVGRYTNPEFRKLAEETVSLNCPVHIHPDVVWLDSARMSAFAALHREWLEARRRAVAGEGDAGAPASGLARFLREAREAADE